MSADVVAKQITDATGITVNIKVEDLENDTIVTISAKGANWPQVSELIKLARTAFGDHEIVVNNTK